MRILLLGLNFSPELIGIGKYTGDLAAYLSREGFDLRVVTTFPYYPEWRSRGKHSGWLYAKEKLGDMVVYRCPLWVPHRPSNLNRIPYLFSFALSSLPVMLAEITWKPDVVICVIPALFSAPTAWLVARLSGAKCWLHIQDFELNAALNLGMLSAKSLVVSAVTAFERLVLSGFDRVSTISESMLALAVQKGVKAEKAVLFPNWVDTCQIFPLQGANPRLAELGIDEGKKVVLYHGNLGRKQGLQTLIEAAMLLKDRDEILFVICGEGAERQELEQSVVELRNVRFVDLQPAEKLNQLVNLADIHILPQRAGAADLVMPSKLTTMLASGKPVVACAAPDTQLWKLLSQVGVTVPPEAPQALGAAILELMNDAEERARLGGLGRAYACQYLEREVVLGRFTDEIEKLLTAG